MAKQVLPKIKLLSFDLHNIEDFIHGEFHTYNPCTQKDQYIEYWDSVLEDIIHGKWGHDYDKKKDVGGYRYISGDLWHYRNVVKIEKGTNVLERPDFRDVDVYFDHGISEAKGFSGYEKDAEKSSFKLLQKMEKGQKLLKREEYFLKEYNHVLRTPKNKYKKYIDPKKNQARTFDKPMGEAQHFNEAQNIVGMMTRGIGKSYTFGVNIMQRGFITNNAKNLDEYYSKKTKFVAGLGAYGPGDTKEVLRKFEESYKSVKEYGSYNIGGCKENGYMWMPISGSEKVNGGHLTNGHLAPGGKDLVGAGSLLIRGTYTRKSTSLRGYRFNWIFNEEWGEYENTTGIHGSNEPAQKRDQKFGVSAYMGTGGNSKMAAKVAPIFKKPSMVNAIGYEDKCTKSNSLVGCFVPGYYVEGVYRDSNGNTNYIDAFNDAKVLRHQAKRKGRLTYLKHIAGYPMIYDDCFMQESQSGLPVDRASERLAYLRKDSLRERRVNNRKIQTGHLEFTSGNKDVRFIQDNNCAVINSLDDIKEFSDEEKRSAHIIYEPPMMKSPFKYLTTYDSVRHDKGTSVCHVHTMKYWSDRPGTLSFNFVAEKTYRERTKALNDEEAIKQAMFYGAAFNPETNVEHIIDSVLKYPHGYDLNPVPIRAIRKIVLQNPKHDFGFFVSPGMKPGLVTSAGESLTMQVDSYLDEDDNEVVVQFVDTIHSEILLETIVYYNLIDNFDVMACYFGTDLDIQERIIEGGFNVRRPTVASNKESFSLLMSKLDRPSIVAKNRVFNV
jgi:hypothetical protein